MFVDLNLYRIKKRSTAAKYDFFCTNSSYHVINTGNYENVEILMRESKINKHQSQKHYSSIKSSFCKCIYVVGYVLVYL